VSKTSKQTGFTLIEMLVAIAVALTFMGGMLFSRGDFDSTVRLGSIAREVALIVREAQTYGAGGGSKTNIGQDHGIFLDDNSMSEIKLYAESNGSTGYQPSTDNLLENFQLPSEYTIDKFCVGGSADDDCSSSSQLADLSVYFSRPSLTANFFNSNGNASGSQRAIIVIKHSGSSNTRSIMIDSAGYTTIP